MGAPSKALNLSLCFVLLLFVAPVGSARGQGPASAGEAVTPRDRSIVDSVGLRQRDQLAERKLMDAITSWLPTQFDLQPVHDRPQIDLVPAAKIVNLGYRRLLLNLEIKTAAGDEGPVLGQRDVVALYDDAARTIYLPEYWRGVTTVEQSVLVHEMVHHFQNVLGIRHSCPQEREKLAYAAQDRWLARSGHSLVDDFDLDPFSLLVRTTCPVLN
jgi:hypothetical protein